jgi:hypothetical protein
MPRQLEKVRFPGEVFLTLEEGDVDFEKAREEVLNRAGRYDSDPMLLAWYDRREDRESPEIACESEDSDPGWVSYAKSHGGDLTVNVNGGDYYFIFKSEHTGE